MITAFIPGTKFPSVSITGEKCELMCKYCMGKYLKGMIRIKTPYELWSIAKGLKRRNAVGMLISGGFDRKGKLPVEPFFSTIKRIKRELDMIISIHPGLVDKDMAVKMRRSGIDVVDYELVLDPIVIKEVMNLSREPDDFIKSLEVLVREGPPHIAVHIPLGMRFGKVFKENEAVEIASEICDSMLTFLVFIPTKGTPMENIPPPNAEEVIEVIKRTRKKIKEIVLGCMRPPELKDTLDPVLIEKKLIDRIAVPRRRIIEEFKLKVVKSCCSIPKELLKRVYNVWERE